MCDFGGVRLRNHMVRLNSGLSDPKKVVSPLSLGRAEPMRLAVFFTGDIALWHVMFCYCVEVSHPFTDSHENSCCVDHWISMSKQNLRPTLHVCCGCSGVIGVTKKNTTIKVDADTCANLITRCVEWFWAIIGVSCACLQQTKHCDSQQVFVNKQYGRSQSAATTYASKLLIQAFCIPVIWFRVRRCCRRAPIVHTTCASAHPLCWRVCVLQSDSPKNANNACANIVFLWYCAWSKGPWHVLLPNCKASTDPSNWSSSVMMCL